MRNPESGGCRFRRSRLALLAGVLAISGWLVIPGGRTARSEGDEVSPDVLQALRKVLSEDPAQESAGEDALKRLGSKAFPHLRTWILRVRHDLDRVTRLLERLEGTPPNPSSPERMNMGEFFSQKLLECRSLVRAGEHRTALSISEAVLILDRSSPYSWELRRIARRARERVVSTQILEPSVDSDKLVYVAGEKPRIVFRVQNHDTKVARILLDRGILGELHSTVTRKFPDGSMKREENRVLIETSADVDQILVGPGLSWEHPVSVEPGDESPGLGAIIRVQIAGRFRPTRWTVERDRDENISLPMNTAEFWIVPPGEEDLCERPVEKLTMAIFFHKPRSFFVGGQIAVWVGEEDAHFNESLVRALISSLDEIDPELMVLADRFLSDATGMRFGGDRPRWKAWWEKTVASRAADGE